MSDIRSAKAFVVTVGDMHLEFSNLHHAMDLFKAISTCTKVTGSNDWDDATITLTAWNGYPNHADSTGIVINSLRLKD